MSSAAYPRVVALALRSAHRRLMNSSPFVRLLSGCRRLIMLSPQMGEGSSLAGRTRIMTSKCLAFAALFLALASATQADPLTMNVVSSHFNVNLTATASPFFPPRGFWRQRCVQRIVVEIPLPAPQFNPIP